MKRASVVAAVIALIVVACGDEDKAIKEPKVHRAAAPLCVAERGAGESLGANTSGAPASCRSDADCTQGTNGRCTGNPHNGYACSYDACANDDACGAKGVCECRTSASPVNNVCLDSGCRTDADCGAAGKGWCSPTLGSCGNYSGAVSWECHTADDECSDDVDCQATSTAGYCKFEKTVGHWKCSTAQCAG